MGQFGDQDTKTSQEQKLWKIGKLGILVKNWKKGHYKWYHRMVLEPDGVNYDSN